MMNISQVEIFLAVVGEGGISKAAEKLQVSQSSISKKLKALEDDLGVKLVERDKGVNTSYLTEEGNKIYPYVKDYYESYIRLVNFKDWEDRSRLNVAAIDSLNSAILLSIYPKLLESFSDIKLTVTTNKTENIYGLVSTNLFDIGLVVNEYQWPNVIVRPFFKEGFKLLVRADENMPTDRPISLSELDPVKEIFQPWGPDHQRWHDYYFPTREYSLQIDSVTINNISLFKPGSWSIVPESVSLLYQDNSDFRLLDFESYGLERQTYYITNENTNPISTSALDKFISLLEDYRKKNYQ